MITCYSVPAEFTSPKFARAFALGAGEGSCVNADPDPELQPGAAALFGSPHLEPVLRAAMADGRTWYYGDHAYFGRRVYFRITRNARQIEEAPADREQSRRFEWLRVVIRPWKTHGRHILLCPNSPAYFRMVGASVDAWIGDTVRKIRRYSDRPIRVRWKTDELPLDRDLYNAWACVNYTSVCGVHAALDGIASFATEPCASRLFGSGDLSLIEHPVRPDNRYELACALANRQWTLDEIEKGEAWQLLN